MNALNSIRLMHKECRDICEKQSATRSMVFLMCLVALQFSGCSGESSSADENYPLTYDLNIKYKVTHIGGRETDSVFVWVKKEDDKLSLYSGVTDSCFFDTTKCSNVVIGSTSLMFANNNAERYNYDTITTAKLDRIGSNCNQNGYKVFAGSSYISMERFEPRAARLQIEAACVDTAYAQYESFWFSLSKSRGIDDSYEFTYYN